MVRGGEGEGKLRGRSQGCVARSRRCAGESWKTTILDLREEIVKRTVSVLSLGQVLPHTSTATVVSNPALNCNTSRRCLQRFVHNPKDQAEEVPAAFRQGVLCTLTTHCGVLLVNLQDVPDVLSTDFSHNFQVVESNRFLVKQCLQSFGTYRKTKLYFRVT